MVRPIARRIAIGPRFAGDRDNLGQFRGKRQRHPLAGGGVAAKIAPARAAGNSRGKAPSPTSTPIWSSSSRAKAAASSGVWTSKICASNSG
jgi:hypothetical protein